LTTISHATFGNTKTTQPSYALSPTLRSPVASPLNPSPSIHNITEACDKYNLPSDHPILGAITAEAPHDFDPIYKIWQTIIFHYEEYGWVKGAFLTLTQHDLNITGQSAVRTQEQLLAGILYYWSENKHIPLETITRVFYHEYRTYPTGLAESGDASRRTKYVEKIKKEHTKNMG
jgi:hypothetical protein